MLDEDRAEWVRHGRSFGAVAGAYAELRPGYPSEAVGFLLGEQPRRVLDLGAGTGKLSESLLAAGHAVLAVDASPQMLGELRSRHPDVLTAAGRAEAIPLPDEAVDAVVAGQAAHWFDLDSAGPEIARVLRPGGALGLVWNLRDERVPWVARLGEVLAAEGRAPQTSAAEEQIVAGMADVVGRDVQRAEFSYVQTIPPEQLVAGLATRSYLVLLEPDQREHVLEQARRLLATHPDTAGRNLIEYRYRTFAYKLSG